MYLLLSFQLVLFSSLSNETTFKVWNYSWRQWRERTDSIKLSNSTIKFHRCFVSLWSSLSIDVVGILLLLYFYSFSKEQEKMTLRLLGNLRLQVPKSYNEQKHKINSDIADPYREISDNIIDQDLYIETVPCKICW